MACKQYLIYYLKIAVERKDNWDTSELSPGPQEEVLNEKTSSKGN